MIQVQDQSSHGEKEALQIMAPPISLTILRKGDTNIVDLAEVGALIPRSETRVDDAFLQEVSAEVGSIGLPRYGQGDYVAVVRDLQRIGALLFSHLLPEATQQRLRTAEPGELYLRLDESLLQVPWELCYDGEQFLALKFRLGRQVITSAPLPQRESIRSEQGALRVLLIADPTETLPQASQEAEQLCEILGGLRGVEVTLLGGHEVRKTPLLLALQAHDIVHFAGHSQYDAQTPSHSGWVLHEGILTAGELRKLARPPSLVFSNSCQAGVTAAWSEGVQYEGQAFGIGSAFLLAGVQNYVGTFWVVHDEESTAFATAFYRSLTAGQSIGEALLGARQTLIAQRGWAGLTWASYMLYGDPAFTLRSMTHPQSLPSGSVAEHSQPVGVLQRKLAAILSADVKGYSRLMGEEEVATIRTLTTYREVMTVLIQQHHGRVVDAPGDNLLAEFASAVDAVQGAVAVQQELQRRNAGLLDGRKMEYRIGLNVGDVVCEDGRIYGDGVNIAARIESLAEGGGICISGTVYDQIENKIPLHYEYLGEQAVKNIKKPVRVYRVTIPPEALASVVNANGLQGQGQCAAPSKPLSEKRRQEESSPIGWQKKAEWLSRQTRPRLSRALIFLAAVAAIVSAVYLPKTLPVRNAAVLSGTPSSLVHDQPPVATVLDASFASSSGTHRSFETAPSHGQRAVSLLDKFGRPVGSYAESHALVVGISNYTGGWRSLPGVKKDVKAVVPVLEKYGFHVVVVTDPTLAELEGAYRDFIGQYGLAPNNRLLFYYAGSGYTIKPTYALSNQEDWMGYLVARDAPMFTDDPEGFRRHALSMERFVSMAREIEAQHALFIFDSCFAGAIVFSLGKPSLEQTRSEITQQTSEPVRQFISAGTVDQQVPDESLFRKLFIQALEGDPEADQNGDGYVTGSELGQFLQEKITTLSGGTQTPQYGKMSDPRLNRGEFVFTPSLSVPPPAIAALPSEW